MKIVLFLLIASLCSAESYNALKTKAFSEKHSMNVRWRSLIRMAEIKKNDSLGDMNQALKSKTWFMRNAALLALESIDSDKAFEAAKKQLDDPALVVRSAAVEVIVKNKARSDEARELLWKELADRQNKFRNKSLWIREQIAQVLSQDPRPHEKDKFLALVEEKEIKIRTLAESALKKLSPDLQRARAQN